MPFTYSGSATTRDERVTILKAIQELTQDEALVLVVKNAMDAAGDVPILVSVSGAVPAFNTAGRVTVSVDPKTLLLSVSESERTIDTMTLFYGDFILPQEVVRVAESLTVVRA